MGGRVFQQGNDGSSGGGAARPRLQIAAWVGFVGLCLLVGAAGGGVTAASLRGWYLTLEAPPGTPPNWVFGPVWSVLYVLIGTAAWLIWRRPQVGQRRALQLWGWQLLLNGLWVPAFFGAHSPGLALAVMLPLLYLIALTCRRFAAILPLAGALLLPYAAWTCYAAYLTVGFVWLNPG